MKKKTQPETETTLGPTDLLDAVPVPNESVRAEPQPSGRGPGGGGIVLRVPLVRRWYMRPPLSWVMPFSRERAVGLDRLGREVWEACDGRRTAEEIIERFSRAHHLTFQEARISVMQFLRDLTRRGLIVMIGTPTDGAGPAAEGAET